MEAIGGYFEFEKTGETAGKNIHKDELFLCSGRSCFNLIIREKAPIKMYVPYYICDSALIPLKMNAVPFEFYEIDYNFYPQLQSVPAEGEYLLYVNYFGLCNNIVSELKDAWGKMLIVDNTQAFFSNSSINSISFTSARKSFGVPDGAFISGIASDNIPAERNVHYTTEHLSLRSKGYVEEGYSIFSEYEKTITAEIKLGSKLSEEILDKIDYDVIQHRRRQNFKLYAKELDRYNQLKIIMREGETPFVYPFLPDTLIDRSRLAEKKIYIPAYWKDVVERDNGIGDIEFSLCEKMLPLPLDHRYDEKEIGTVINEVLSLLL